MIYTSEGIRVYIHYPFCLSKCPYCAFPSRTNRILEQEYLNALFREIDTFSFNRPVYTIYFGGGSPSLMEVETVEKIISMLKKYCTEDAEISIELKPEDCKPGFSKKYSLIGINRISIGIQSFLSQKLKLFRRETLPQDYTPPDDVVISFDIIIGTVFDDLFFDNEVRAISTLKPDHISLYPLVLEPGSSFFDNPPDCISGNIGKQYEKYGEVLLQYGYFRYEASNYCRNENMICQHSAGYWTNDDFVGFGVAAHSKVGRESWHNTFSIADYIDSTKRGFVDKTDCIVLEECEYAEQTLLLGLRLTDGISLESTLSRTTDSKSIVPKINLLVKNGYVKIENGFVKPARNINFEQCIDLVGWYVNTRNSWKTILPKRLKSRFSFS